MPHKKDGSPAQERRKSFFNRQKSDPDEWDTTYKTHFMHGYKPPTKHVFNYRSQYGQPAIASQNAKAEKEKTFRLAVFQQASTISEPLIRGLTNLCERCSVGEIDKLHAGAAAKCDPGFMSCIQCGRELTNLPGSGQKQISFDPERLKPREYSKDMPTVPRPQLPKEIAEPKFVQLQARDWKGVPYPSDNPIFEPLLPVTLDGSIAPTTLDPFKYCQRRRQFPQFNKCPNLPIPLELLSVPEPAGFYALDSKLFNKRLAKRRFSRPPEVFLTHLW